MIGGARVPAGSYTLWTLPTRSGWKLIINRQTGQWGTEYDPAQDLVRVELSRAAAATPVEQFTIRLSPQGASGGVMHLEWGEIALSVPFSVQ